VRNIVYKIEHFKEGTTVNISSSLANFAMTLPYLFHLCYIPPLVAMNDTFQSGRQTDGESKIYVWSPFFISQMEYQALIEKITSRWKYLRIIDSPDWVKSSSDWFVCLYEQVYGWPAQEHLSLRRELIALNDQLEQALLTHNKEREEEVRVKLEDVTRQLTLFMQGNSSHNL
jgi:hypothetical protein